MNYYEIIKNSKVDISNVKFSPIHDESIISLIENRYKSGNRIITGLLSNLLLETNSEYNKYIIENNYFIDNYDIYKLKELLLVVPNYIENIFNLVSGPLLIAVIKRLMEKFEVEDPINLLRYDIPDSIVIFEIEDIINSNGGIFYGVYTNFNEYNILRNKKSLIIHSFKINSNNYSRLYSSCNYIKTADFYKLNLTLPLFILKHEGGKLIPSSSIGWRFFLTKEHVNDFLKKMESELLTKLHHSIKIDKDTIPYIEESLLKTLRKDKEKLKRRKKKANNLIIL